MTGKKMLILGASGGIGLCMYEHLGPERSIASYFANRIEGGIYFDALHQDIAEVVSPDEIWHCMIFLADSDPDSCESNPVLSHKLNVESTCRIIDRLETWQMPFTFASSECVFDGSSGPNIEGDVAKPIMLYGQQKLDVEHYLGETYPDSAWTIMRLGKVFGASTDSAKLFSGWIGAIENGDVIRIATDQMFSPIHVSDVVKACLLAAEKKAWGLYHLCGLRPYSRYELLQMVVKFVRRYNDSEARIEKCSIDDFDLRTPRPKNCSMLPTKLIDATGLYITPIDEVCRRIVDEYYAVTDMARA